MGSSALHRPQCPERFHGPFNAAETIKNVVPFPKPFSLLFFVDVEFKSVVVDENKSE
jgi:hypothetical protein